MTKKTRRAKARRALLALSLVLVTMMVAVGGTIAWLTDATDEIVNTFASTDININLEESTGTNYEMVPGSEIEKDPAATVLTTTTCGDVYLFVKIEKSTNFDDFMEFDVAGGWIPVENHTGLYYREVAEANFGTPYPIIADDTVTVLDTVEKADMEALTADTYPKLTFDSFAIQKENVTLTVAIEKAVENLY